MVWPYLGRLYLIWFFDMKYKRKKSKRSVKCTICTPFRWLGNKLSRLTKQRQVDKQVAKEQMKGLYAEKYQ